MIPSWKVPPTLVALLLLAAPLSAQQRRPPAGGQQQTAPAEQQQGGAAEAELIFEREVFQYPTFQRRNPFKPLVGNEGGPRYEQILLRGIIYSEDARESVALLGLRQRAAQQAQRTVQQQERALETGTAEADTIIVPETTQRLRVGERWGNMRIVQIRRDHVVVDVEEFGLTEQRILTMPIRRTGGL